MPDFGSLNYLAILVSVVASMVIGSVYYSSMLFGKKWEELVGMKMSDVGIGYAIATLVALVMSFSIAVLFQYARVTTLVGGLKIGLLVFVGLVLTTNALANAFQRKSWQLYFLDMGNHLLTIAAISAILAGWR